jgi:hypothetical protein
MMRKFAGKFLTVSALALGSAVALTAPADAATIVQNIPGLVQDLGDFTPFDINALPFNTSLGTLTGVSVEIIGNVTPMTANDLGPFPSTTDLTTHLFVFPTNAPPGNTTTITFATQTGVPVVVASPGSAGEATGAVIAVDQTINFSDLNAFITAISGSQLLVEYGFKTANTLSAAGGASDLTSFKGSAVLTYTYDAPEPVTLSLFGAGLVGAGWISRRRRNKA